MAIPTARKLTYAEHRLNIKSALAAESRAGSSPATGHAFLNPHGVRINGGCNKLIGGHPEYNEKQSPNSSGGRLRAAADF